MKLHAIGMGLIVLGLSLLPAAVQAATPSIGHVARITGSQLGNAEAPGGPARKLAAGDPIYAGERIRTGAGTVLQIEFTDKSRFVLGPNAEFEVGRYRYASGGAEEDTFHSRILKGAFRFVSVVIDKPGYGTEIPDEKSPPSPVKRMQLRTIDNLQRAIRSPARTGGPARRP